MRHGLGELAALRAGLPEHPARPESWQEGLPRMGTGQKKPGTEVVVFGSIDQGKPFSVHVFDPQPYVENEGNAGFREQSMRRLGKATIFEQKSKSDTGWWGTPLLPLWRYDQILRPGQGTLFQTPRGNPSYFPSPKTEVCRMLSFLGPGSCFCF